MDRLQERLIAISCAVRYRNFPDSEARATDASHRSYANPQLCDFLVIATYASPDLWPWVHSACPFCNAQFRWGKASWMACQSWPVPLIRRFWRLCSGRRERRAGPGTCPLDAVLEQLRSCAFLVGCARRASLALFAGSRCSLVQLLRSSSKRVPGETTPKCSKASNGPCFDTIVTGDGVP